LKLFDYKLYYVYIYIYIYIIIETGKQENSKYTYKDIFLRFIYKYIYTIYHTNVLYVHKFKENSIYVYYEKQV
jgi:hypothetical protein